MNVMEKNKGLAGSSVIEVVISLAVVVVGLLGMASLQYSSPPPQVTDNERAGWLANEMASRIRSNNPQAIEYYIGTSEHGEVCLGEPTVYCGAGYGLDEVMCSLEQQASFDVWDVFCNSDKGGELSRDSKHSLFAVFSIDCEDNDLTDLNTCSYGSLIDISVLIRSTASLEERPVVRDAQIIMSL